MADTARMGYYFDQQACIGCRTCQVACCDKNDLAADMTFRTVRSFEVGEFPDAKAFHYSGTCNHCENPACVEACPAGAMYKDENDGTVQHDDTKCIGCQSCAKACPYSVPRYMEDIKIVRKCDACKVLRENGEQPACVSSCPMRALEFGPYDELVAAHPDAVSDITILPESSMTGPSTLINAKPCALKGEPVEVVL